MKLIQILNEVTGEYELFVDLDGVLTDFNKQITKYFNVPNADAFFNQSNENQEAWQKIKEVGEDFWTGMKWLPGSRQLWSVIQKSGCPIRILTAPPKPHNIDMGYIKQVMGWKIQWVRSNLGGVKVLFAYTGEKGKFAKPNRILIDDQDRNIVDWKGKGGIPVQFDNVQSVVKKLKQLGVKI